MFISFLIKNYNLIGLAHFFIRLITELDRLAPYRHNQVVNLVASIRIQYLNPAADEFAYLDYNTLY